MRPSETPLLRPLPVLDAPTLTAGWRVCTGAAADCRAAIGSRGPPATAVPPGAGQQGGCGSRNKSVRVQMPRARRGVVSPADAAAARKRLLDAQLGEAKAAKAAKSSKGKPMSAVAASPKSERVDPPGSPATSSSAPGNKKVELKPVSPPVRPEPKTALEDECKACQGAHRAHTVSLIAGVRQVDHGCAPDRQICFH